MGSHGERGVLGNSSTFKDEVVIIVRTSEMSTFGSEGQEFVFIALDLKHLLDL